VGDLEGFKESRRNCTQTKENWCMEEKTIGTECKYDHGIRVEGRTEGRTVDLEPYLCNAQSASYQYYNR